jgi:hypothetical protein
VTPREAATAMRRYQREMRSPVLKTLNRVLYAARGSAMKTISGSGWGRKFYSASGPYGAKGRATLGALVRVKAAKWDGSQYVGTIRAKGLPGWLELGGRTRPHPIPKSGKTLMAFSLGGSSIFAFKVNHPGAAVPGTHAIEKAMAKYGAQLKPEIDAGLQQLAAQTGLAA